MGSEDEEEVREKNIRRALVTEVAEIQADKVIEAIQKDMIRFGKAQGKRTYPYESLDDFLLGYEIGYMTGNSLRYYKNLLERNQIRSVSPEEWKEIHEDINKVILGRLAELREAIGKAYSRL